ncbi:MAG: response regulator [Planctomycetes bacterium]|nr:response regulator [Planctomycetota bacterium]
MELLEHTTPVLVIIDMQLPRLSGLELLHELRRRNRDVPVLVVTGEDHTATLAEALGEGASSFMRKPVQPDLLISAVHRLLPEFEDSIA